MTRNAISSLRNEAARHELELKRFDERNFNQEIEDQRQRAKRLIGNRNSDDASRLNALRSMEEFDGTTSLPDGYRLTGAYSEWSQAGYRTVVPETRPVSSHPVIEPNYTATRDGDNIILSSGIKCDVTVTQALAWLRGGPAPHTRYGSCRLVEASTVNGSPVKIIECGCHKLDIRNFGPEFEELLKPTHVVTFTPGKPSIVWSPETKEAFLARLKENVDAFIAGNHKAKRDAANAYFQKRKELIDLRDNKEARKAQMQQKIDELKLKAAELEAETEKKTITKFSGSLEDLNNAMITAINSLCGIRA